MDKKEYRQYAMQAANGDAKAFSKLYQLVYRDMYYTAFYTLKNDEEAIAAITETARDGFGAIANLHNEQQFRVYMMRTLCARMKAFYKRYSDNSLDENQPEIKTELFELPNVERMIFAMNVAGKFSCEEIALFAGMTKIGVRKKLARAMQKLGIEE